MYLVFLYVEYASMDCYTMDILLGVSPNVVSRYYHNGDIATSEVLFFSHTHSIGIRTLLTIHRYRYIVIGI